MTCDDGIDEAASRAMAAQFKKGQSGNPFGHPKGARGMKSIVQAIAHERHKVKENGKTTSYLAVHLVLIVLQRKALEGNLAAAKLLDSFRGRFGVMALDKNSYGFLIVPEQKTMENTPIPIEDVEEDDPQRLGMPPASTFGGV